MRVASNIHPQTQFKANIKADKIPDLVDRKFGDKTYKVFNLEKVRDWAIPVKYKVAMDAQSVKKLFEVDDTNQTDFMNASYDFFCKNLNIPEQIKPVMVKAGLPEEYPLGYDIFTNSIVQNAKYTGMKLSKEDIFTMLRHEFQHFLQNMEIYRHETLGKDWLKTVQEMYGQRNREGIKNMLMTKQIDEWGCLPGSKIMDLLYEMRNRLRNNDIAGFDNLYECIKQGNNNSLQWLRNTIVETKGVIKKESKTTDLIKTYMDSIIYNLNFVNKGNSVDFNAYKENFIEKEAFATQLDSLEDMNKILEKSE